MGEAEALAGVFWRDQLVVKNGPPRYSDYPWVWAPVQWIAPLSPALEADIDASFARWLGEEGVPDRLRDLDHLTGWTVRFDDGDCIDIGVMPMLDLDRGTAEWRGGILLPSSAAEEG